jgi:hypothetical protein
MEFSLLTGDIVIEVMSHTEHFTPTLAQHHQQLIQNSILADHTIGGATYKVRCQVIPHPADGVNLRSLIMILLLVDNIWQLGGVLGRLISQHW